MSDHNTQIIDYSPILFGAGGPPAAGSANGSPFTKRVVATGGAPTIVGATGGGWVMSLTSDSEAQAIGFDCDDKLVYDIDDLKWIEWLAKINAAPGTNVELVMGLGGAYNATPDSVAQNAWFKMVDGDLTVFAESDDGTNDNDDKSTGVDMVADTLKRFRIDFSEGVQTRQPPLASLGGKANVYFRMGDANNFGGTRVVASTLFDMSNYSGGLQPYFYLRKSSGTATGSLTIKSLRVGIRTY